MKKLFIVCLLLYAAWYFSPYKNTGGYTVRFVSKQGDTTWLLNSRPLTFNEADKIADGYRGNAEPVCYNSRPFKVK